MTTKQWLGAAVVTLGLVSAAAAQQLWIGDSSGYVTKWADKSAFDGSVLFCRGYYGQDRREEGGSGWWTDYPGADQNFLVRLSELSKVQVRFDLEHRMPFYVVVKLDDPLLSKCPVLFLSDAGTMRLSGTEVAALQSYMSKGGFIWADDFWGEEAWEQFEYEIRRVLPTGQYSKTVDITTGHPILNQLYTLDGIWQQPRIGVWQGVECPAEDVGCEPGQTSERGQETATPHMYGIEDAHGRVVMVATHNTDIGDGFEEEKPENIEYTNQFAAKSYALGIDIFLYALTH